jgi:hypothetical protein
MAPEFVIASEATQSRIVPRRDSGLLRFARNDGGVCSDYANLTDTFPNTPKSTAK